MRDYDKVIKLLTNEIESLEVLYDLKNLSTKFNLPKEVKRLEKKIGKKEDAVKSLREELSAIIAADI
jgi:hypothetical protein